MKTIKNVMDIKIADFEFSVRCSNCMRNMKIETLSDLTRHSQDELMKMRNMGNKSIQEITGKLSAMGLWFGMSDRDWVQWGLEHIELIKRL